MPSSISQKQKVWEMMTVVTRMMTTMTKMKMMIMTTVLIKSWHKSSNYHIHFPSLELQSRNHTWLYINIVTAIFIYNFHMTPLFLPFFQTQLVYNDGSKSETVIEVNLRHPGKHDRNVVNIRLP